MGMTYKSPLGRLPKTRSVTEARRDIVPDVIRLPDGREFLTRDILVKPRDRVSYNLRAGIEFGHRFKRKMAKNPVDTEPKE